MKLITIHERLKTDKGVVETPILINPDYIIRVKPVASDRGGREIGNSSHIALPSYTYLAKETPEEIVALIAKAFKYIIQ